MMMRLIKDISIFCHNCGLIIPYLKSQFDATLDYYDHGDNAMGTEIIYTINEDCICPRCHSHIIFTITGSEYPIGGFNGTDFSVHGGRFIELPYMDIVSDDGFIPCMDVDVDWTFINASPFRKMMIAVCRNPDILYEITPRDFEVLVARLFADEGYNTIITPQTRDGGLDIRAQKSDNLNILYELLIECKRYAPSRKVDRSTVMKLFGVLYSDTANKGVIVTTSYFTRDACAFIEEQGSLLTGIDRDKLLESIKQSVSRYYRGQLK